MSEGPLDEISVHLVDSYDEAQDFMAWLGRKREWMGVDCETTGFNVGRDRLRLVQFGDATDGWSIPWEGWGGLVIDAVKRYDRRIVAHNLLFDSKFLKREGIVIPQHLAHDSMVMAHLVDPRLSGKLESAAARHVDKRAFMGARVMKDAFKEHGWDYASVPTNFGPYWSYAAIDAVLTALLAGKLWSKTQDFIQAYEVELGCINVLREAGLTGMAVDVDYCRKQLYELRLRQTEVGTRIPVDPAKDKDIYELFRDNIDPWPTTEKGNPSTDDSVLEALENKGVPHARDIRLWRQCERLCGTYFTGLIDQNVNGIVYPSVKVLGARTGRMSVTEPALQTIPRGVIVRDAFVARPGQQLVIADYEQLELRVLASFAKEEAMIEAFNRGDDLHTWVASNVYGVPLDEVTAQQRQLCKNAQFARVYGAGDAKIALAAGVPVEAVEDFMTRYAAEFPRIPAFMHETMMACKSTTYGNNNGIGYVDTVLGRRLPVDKSKVYVSVNYMVQSSATADLLKLKIIELANSGLEQFIRLPIHDEVIFEVPEEDLEDAMITVADVMPERKLFAAPLTIDGPHSYYRWGDKYR